MSKWIFVKRKIHVMFLMMSGVLLTTCEKQPGEPVSPDQTASVDTTLATITYSLDDAAKKSAVLDTGTTVITVTDGAGEKWTLTIPPQFGSETGATITMTPLKSIVTTSTVHSITSGIIFGPEGYYFSDPATLTVEIPSSTVPNVFYSIESNGTKIDFAAVNKKSSAVYSASIVHFSGIGGGSPKDVSAAAQAAKARYDKAVADAKTALTGTPVVPPPPEIELKCDQPDATANRLIDIYVKQFLAPEESFVKEIHAATAAYQELTGQDLGGLAEACKISQRWIDKARSALQIYKDPKYYYPVGRAVILADRQRRSLCNDQISIASELCPWVTSIRDLLFKQFNEQHDYRLLKTIVSFDRQALSLSCTDVSIAEKLVAAMKFKISYKNEILTYDGTRIAQKYLDSGNVNLTYNQQNGWMSGQGSIKVYFGQMTSPEGCVSSLTPTTFDFVVDRLVVNGCDPAEVLIEGSSSFGPQLESWTLCGPDDQGGCTCMSGTLPPPGAPPPGPLALMSIGFLTAEGYIPTPPGPPKYRFKLPLQNMNAEAATFQFVKNYGEVTYTLILTVTHTPS